ncbi:MAG: uroporphyrinogen-III synthase [Acidimicrobiia bacterium]
MKEPDRSMSGGQLEEAGSGGFRDPRHPLRQPRSVGGTVRLAVTTTADRAEPLLAALAAQGLEPLSLPAVRAEASEPAELARAAASCEDADVMVFTSPRPIALLWDAGLPSTRAAVCGAGTAEEVEKRGGTVWASGTGTAADLAQMVAPGLGGLDVAFPHARGADPRVALTLADAARSLTAVAVYELLAEPAPREPVEGVIFTHPQAVDGWLLSRGLANTFVVTVGRATMGALRRHGRRPDLALRNADLPAIAEAIFYAMRPSTAG